MSFLLLIDIQSSWADTWESMDTSEYYARLEYERHMLQEKYEAVDSYVCWIDWLNAAY